MLSITSNTGYNTQTRKQNLDEKRKEIWRKREKNGKA